MQKKGRTDCRSCPELFSVNLILDPSPYERKAGKARSEKKNSARDRHGAWDIVNPEVGRAAISSCGILDDLEREGVVSRGQAEIASA